MYHVNDMPTGLSFIFEGIKLIMLGKAAFMAHEAENLFLG
jgi:hypothetical protein